MLMDPQVDVGAEVHRLENCLFVSNMEVGQLMEVQGGGYPASERHNAIPQRFTEISQIPRGCTIKNRAFCS
jgi:hypothetical protein